VNAALGASAILMLRPELQAEPKYGGFLMKIKSLRLAILIVILTVSAGALAHAESPFLDLTGVINGFSPATVNPAGPWEIHGTWCLRLNLYTQTADFTADLTMERSDYWVIATADDPDTTTDRMSHTHHVALRHIKITSIPNGFQMTGIATITKDGSPAPFNPAPLQVNFTGGTSLLISNVALTFLNPTTGNNASLHFGSLPILGVVGKPD
jgi:hypothetical protein